MDVCESKKTVLKIPIVAGLTYYDTINQTLEKSGWYYMEDRDGFSIYEHKEEFSGSRMDNLISSLSRDFYSCLEQNIQVVKGQIDFDKLGS